MTAATLDKEALASRADEPPALSQLRREAKEASKTVYLEGDKELQCTVRPLKESELQQQRMSETVPSHAAAAAAANDDASSLGMEIIFSFRQSVLDNDDQRRLFMHWGMGQHETEWKKFSPSFKENFSCSAYTNFVTSCAAETEFVSPRSSPPPVVTFRLPAGAHAPRYMSFLFYVLDNNHPWKKQWIHAQHGGSNGNISLNVRQLLQQALQQQGFLAQVTLARESLFALAEKQLQQTQQYTDGLTSPLLPLTIPETCKYWTVPVGDLRVQVLAFSYINAVAAAVEIFVDFAAALTLYWGGSRSSRDAWSAVPADALLGQPGLPNAVPSVVAATVELAAAAEDKAERKRLQKEASEMQRMIVQFGGFSTYFSQGGKACQTQFQFMTCPSGGLTSLQRVSLCIGGAAVPQGLVFLLREVKADRWFKDNGGNFFLSLPTHRYWVVCAAEEEKRKQHEQQLQQQRTRLREQHFAAAVALFQQGKPEREKKGILSYRCVTLSENIGFLDAYAYADDPTNPSAVYLHLTVCTRVPVVLHWGVLDIMGSAQTHEQQQQQPREERWQTWAKEGMLQADLEKKREEEVRRRMALRGAASQWIIPPQNMRPLGTVIADPDRAVQTPFESENVSENAKQQHLQQQIDSCSLLQQLTLNVPACKCPRVSEEDPGVDTRYDGIACCLKEVGGHRWFRNQDGTDIQIRLVEFGSPVYHGQNAEFVKEIVEAEVEWQHMTLMHRYDLMRSAMSKFQQKHAVYVHSNEQLQQRLQLEQQLARDWAQRHYETPPLLLPGGFTTQSTSNVQQLPQLSPYIRDYEQLSSSVVEEERDWWAWMYVWGRFAFLGLLDWQRNYNTKPKDLAWASAQLTAETAKCWRMYPAYRHLIRSCLGTMGRGGAQGQAIRDKILEIMHKHKIPEKAGLFYEQWHQKLHNNTTPDDVGICEAVIAFLEGHGNMEAYWRVLLEHGITRERLASYERKITCEPYVVPTNREDLINDFKRYLVILKDVHDALDIQQAFSYAKNYLKAEEIRMVEDVIAQLGRLPAAQKQRQQEQLLLLQKGGSAKGISQHQQQHANTSCGGGGQLALNCFHTLAEVRKKILFSLYCDNGALLDSNNRGYDASATRELLFLDLSLEQQQSVLLQGCCTELSLQQLFTVIREMLLTLSAHMPLSMELRAMYADLAHMGDALVGLVGNSKNNSNSGNSAVEDEREAALLLKAFADRAARYLGTVSDAAQEQLGSKAVFLGQQVGTAKKVRDVFVDEVLRGSVFFPLSLALKRVEPLLRDAAQLPPWQLVSIVSNVQGELLSIDALHNIQDKVYETPTVLLCGAVSGEEEIPVGVQAVLVRSAAVSPDILSHVAVRARNAHVLVAVCFDAEVAKNLEKLTSQWVVVTTAKDGSSLSVEACTMRPAVQVARKASRLFNRQQSQVIIEEESLQLQRQASFLAQRSSRGSECVGAAGFFSVVDKRDSLAVPPTAASNIFSKQPFLRHMQTEKRQNQDDNHRDHLTPEDLSSACETNAINNQQGPIHEGGGDKQTDDRLLHDPMRLLIDGQSTEWCIPSAAFSREVVGGKSFNIKRLADALQKQTELSVLTPRSIALPYGCMQKVLHAADNKETLTLLQPLLQQLSPSHTTNAEAQTIFEKVRNLLMHATLPVDLLQAIQRCATEEDRLHSVEPITTTTADAAALQQSTAVDDELQQLGERPTLMHLWRESGEAKCMRAIKAVWESMFAMRPWVGLAKAGLDFADLNMAVLIQELMPAHCAFVLHSKNPFSNDENEMYGEIALGLGEVIVGNYGGRSLGWKMKRNEEPVIVAFPSKSDCLICPPCLIFRSDSNGEDLDNFAGAGLFETVPAYKSRMQTVAYWSARIINDKFYRRRLLKKLGNLAFIVRDIFGQPQDIEGTVVGSETVAVVQSRQQV